METQPSARTGPYLENVNMDPLLSARWIHFLKQGRTLIGKTGVGEQSIEMMGPGYNLTFCLANHVIVVVKCK